MAESVPAANGGAMRRLLPGWAQGSPLGTLLFYTGLMVTVPLAVFFAAQWLIGAFFDATVMTSSIGATVVSVLCVHLVLGLFVYEAYCEKDEDVSKLPERPFGTLKQD